MHILFHRRRKSSTIATMYSETMNIYVMIYDQKDPFFPNFFKASLKPRNLTPSGLKYNVIMTTDALMTVDE